MRKRCLVCQGLFKPAPKVGDRQKICGAKSCKAAHEKRRQAEWRKSARNKGYDKGRYVETRNCPSRNPEYRNKYRKQKHVKAANAAYMRGYRAKKRVESGKSVRCTNVDIAISPEKTGVFRDIAVTRATVCVRRTNGDIAITIGMVGVLETFGPSPWVVRCTNLDGSS